MARGSIYIVSSAILLGLSFGADIRAAAPSQAAPTQTVPEQIDFGGEDGLPPMEWNDGGRPAGFNVDLAAALAEQGGKTSKQQLGAWPEIIRSLHAGEIDVVAMYKSPERERTYLFTDAFYYLHHAIYSAKSGLPIRSLQELRGKRVAVEASSLSEIQLRKEVPGAIAIATSNTQEALRAIADGEADYAIATTLSADRLIGEYDYDITQTSTPIWPVGYAFATTKDRPELAAWLQTSLAETNASGQFQVIYEKWKPELVPLQSQKQTLRMLKFGIGGLLGALALALLWHRSLARKVDMRTRELKNAIAEQEKTKSELEYVADFDSDTGLSRPSHFVANVDVCLQDADVRDGSAKELMVVKMMALDEVVRVFGYEHSKAMVLTFARNIRTIPHLQSAHLGRGVFAVLMTKGEGHAFVKRMATLFACVDQGGGARLVGGSAYWPEQGGNATQLISKAETALSVAMERKREWIAYQDDMEPNVLDLEICSIFANDESVEIRPVFQPIMDLRTGAIVSAEILARWDHPERGEIPPSIFVTALEKAGLSAKLASTMIDHAVRVGKTLSDSGIRCTISVNITAHDLVEWNLVDGIQSSLHKHTGRADLIRLELTETSVASDPTHARTVLEHLQTLGILASVDDFGTGYSSLSYLSMFPIRELKIDRSFVTQMLQNARHRSIVKSTIAMARELGLTVTAEGVEDEATLDGLKADGCTSAQGYWVSKPLPEGEFMAYMQGRVPGP